MTDNKKTCPGCGGQGEWYTECCNGSDGCSCQGGMVPMGTCGVCNGEGHVVEGEHDPMANINALRGYCFAGSGPSTGFWAGRGKRMNRGG